MCIFGGDEQKGPGFTPGDPKPIESVSELPQASDLKQDYKADLQLGSPSTKKKPTDEAGNPLPTGAAALAINPQPTGINV